MLRFLHSSITRVAALAMLVLLANSLGAQVCLDKNDALDNMVRNQRSNLSHGYSAETFSLVHLGRSDTNLIQPVRTASLCNRAGVVIAKEIGAPADHTPGVKMITLGTYFLVSIPNELGVRSEFERMWILDSSLTVVVKRYQPAHGK